MRDVIFDYNREGGNIVRDAMKKAFLTFIEALTEGQKKKAAATFVCKVEGLKDNALFEMAWRDSVIINSILQGK